MGPYSSIYCSRNKELHLQHLKTRLMQETRNHQTKEYDDKGRPKETNLSPQEIRGIKAAKEIVENGGVIRPTDKTGKHCVSSNINYTEKMQEHIANVL